MHKIRVLFLCCGFRNLNQTISLSSSVLLVQDRPTVFIERGTFCKPQQVLAYSAMSPVLVIAFSRLQFAILPMLLVPLQIVKLDASPKLAKKIM